MKILEGSFTIWRNPKHSLGQDVTYHRSHWKPSRWKTRCSGCRTLSRRPKSNSGARQTSLCSSGCQRGRIPSPCLQTTSFGLLVLPLPRRSHPQSRLRSRRIRCHPQGGSPCRLFSIAWCSVASRWSKSIWSDVNIVKWVKDQPQQTNHPSSGVLTRFKMLTTVWRPWSFLRSTFW